MPWTTQVSSVYAPLADDLAQYTAIASICVRFTQECQMVKLPIMKAEIEACRGTRADPGRTTPNRGIETFPVRDI